MVSQKQAPLFDRNSLWPAVAVSTFHHLTYCVFQFFIRFSLPLLLHSKPHNGKDFFVVHHIGVLLVFFSHTFVCRLYFTMEFLLIYGLAYYSVKVADPVRARGLIVAIYARIFVSDCEMPENSGYLMDKDNIIYF